MCGSSAAKSYGSLGSSCAMRPPRGRASEHAKERNRTSGGRAQEAGCRNELSCHLPPATCHLTDGQHSVESDLRPVLLIVGERDAIVDAAVDQLFKNPEQMIWRHSEHRRAQTTKLIERDNTPLGCDFPGEAID